jgi:hypothetical protein
VTALVSSGSQASPTVHRTVPLCRWEDWSGWIVLLSFAAVSALIFLTLKGLGIDLWGRPRHGFHRRKWTLEAKGRTGWRYRKTHETLRSMLVQQTCFDAASDLNNEFLRDPYLENPRRLMSPATKRTVEKGSPCAVFHVYRAGVHQLQPAASLEAGWRAMELTHCAHFRSAPPCRRCDPSDHSVSNF